MKIDLMKRVVVSLDGVTIKRAKELVKLLGGKVWGFKLNDLVYEEFDFIYEVKESGGLFLDLKLFDIPNTVANTVKRISKFKPDIITVHTRGGEAMLAAAKAAALETTKIIGVTVLTSEAGDQQSVVYNLAKLAKTTGLDGIVLSGQELSYLAATKEFSDLLKVVPGIRSDKSILNDDQKRTVRAKDAFTKGADLVVIGRPLIVAPSPIEVLTELI